MFAPPLPPPPRVLDNEGGVCLHSHMASVSPFCSVRRLAEPPVGFLDLHFRERENKFSFLCGR